MLLVALALLLLDMRSLSTGAAGSRGIFGLDPSAGPEQKQP
jgi:hypothetical protein